MLVLIWAYLHHFCAGIRHLLLDMHLGVEQGQRQADRHRRARRQPRAVARVRPQTVRSVLMAGTLLRTDRPEAPGRRRALRSGRLARAALHRRRDGASTRSSCWSRSSARATSRTTAGPALFARPWMKVATFVTLARAGLSRVGRHARHLDGLRQAGRHAPRCCSSRRSSGCSPASGTRSSFSGESERGRQSEPSTDRSPSTASCRVAASTRSSSAPAAPACARRCNSPRPACRSRCCRRCSRRARTRSRRRAASARRSAT